MTPPPKPTPAPPAESPFAKAFREAAGGPPPAAEADARTALAAWSAGRTPDTTAALLTAVDPLVRAAVSAHTGGADALAVGRGRRLALAALPRYDPSKASMKTFLHAQLAGVRRQARRAARPVGVAEAVGRERARAQAAEEELTESLGRLPSAQEVADRVGIPLARLAAVRTHRPAVAAARFGDGGPAVSPAGGHGPSAWVDLVYGDLPPHLQTVMEHTLGLYGREVLSTVELARRLHRSPGAVSQARAKIQAMLDEEPELSPFGASRRPALGPLD